MKGRKYSLPREANTHTPIKPSAAITVPTTMMGFLFPRGVDLVGEFAEEGEKDESQYIIGGDDHPVQHGVQPEDVVVYGLHDRVVRTPEEGDPPERQRTQQSSFEVELHKKIIPYQADQKQHIRESKAKKNLVFSRKRRLFVKIGISTCDL